VKGDLLVEEENKARWVEVLDEKNGLTPIFTPKKKRAETSGGRGGKGEEVTVSASRLTVGAATTADRNLLEAKPDFGCSRKEGRQKRKEAASPDERDQEDRRRPTPGTSPFRGGGSRTLRRFFHGERRPFRR